MSKMRDPSVEDFGEYLESKPSRLGCWRDGSPGRLPTLAWLNVEPVVQLRSLAAEVGPIAAAGLQTAAHHNQVGIAAGWLTKYMLGPGRDRPTQHQDRVALFELAARYYGLKNALVEVQAGIRTYETKGTLVRLAYEGNHRVDALDRILDFLHSLKSMESPPQKPNPRLSEWARTVGLDTPWDVAPPWAKDGYRAQAESALVQYQRYLEPQVKVAGFAIADYDRFWAELLAMGLHAYTATVLGTESRSVAMPVVARTDFVQGVAARAGITEQSADAITTVLTLDLDLCPDGALTPLVAVDEAIVPMSALIIPGSPHRNLLAKLQSDLSTYGEAGRILGIAGEHETIETLSRMADHVLVGRRIKVTRANGDSAGDLDVVVCDPKTEAVAIFEIKWHIAADGNAEVYRAEQQAREKRKQVVRLRSEIESGLATVAWPTAWPDVSEWKWRWYVLTRDVLATQHIADDNVTVRSLQLLQFTLPAGSGGIELIKALDEPPDPPEALCETAWDRVRYGDLRVDLEVIVA